MADSRYSQAATGPQYKKLLLGFVGFVVGVVVLLGIIIWIPQRQVAPWRNKLENYNNDPQKLAIQEYLKLENDARKLENDARTTLVQAVGGAALLIGLIFTWRSLRATERNLLLSQETAANNLAALRDGQITERFTRAVEQLGSDKLQVRLGGIYALGRIARESELDHWPIMEILTAYIRENAPWPSKKGQLQPLTAPGQALLAPPADIQAILTVLGKRTQTYKKGEDRQLNLTRTDLRHALLSGANLEGALLHGAHLAGAALHGAHLAGAVLWGTNLMGTDGLTLEQLATVETLHDAKLNPSLLEEIQHKHPWLLEKQPWMVGTP